MSTKDISDLQVCEAYLDASLPCGVCPLEILKMRTGEPTKVCFSAISRAVDRGLIEYGVHLRKGWLTEKGHALIDNHNARKTNDVAPGSKN